MHPHVHMRRAAPMPDEGWALETPVIPNAISTEVIALVKREVAVVEPTVFLESGDGLILITLAERLEEEAENFLQVLFTNQPLWVL